MKKRTWILVVVGVTLLCALFILSLRSLSEQPLRWKRGEAQVVTDIPRIDDVFEGFSIDGKVNYVWGFGYRHEYCLFSGTTFLERSSLIEVPGSNLSMTPRRISCT